MPLREEMEQTGNWFFRWRSYLPLGLFVVAAAMMRWGHSPFKSGRLDNAWDAVCVVVSFLGLGIRVFTVAYAPRGTSGRNVKGQIADELNTTGMYSVVRHPLYLGNFFMWLGIAMFPGVAWLVVMAALVFFLYYERIMLAEEAFLRQRYGDAFETWAGRTPPFVPKFRAWQKPALPFSLRSVLRREYSGVFATMACFTVLEAVGNQAIAGTWRLGPAWIVFFTLGLLQFLVLRSLKRHRLLNVQGR